MKRQIKFSPAAEEELKDIWQYVLQYNTQAARKLFREFNQKFKLLRDSPLLGRARDDLLVGLRCFVHREYLIFYTPLDDGIEIYHVLHSSRDIQSLFKRFFDSL
jgi:toxin ParE1/3/4